MLWYWDYDGSKLYLEAGAAIRLRIVSDSFYENPPLQKGTRFWLAIF